MIPTLDQSGAERQLTLLVTNLPREQYLVRVIALNRGGFYQHVLQEQGVEVEVLHKRFRFDVLTWIRLRRRLHQLKPDIIHSYLFAANAYVRLPGVSPSCSRIVISERCVDSWKAGWQIRMDRWLADRTSALVANSKSVGRFYVDHVGVSESLVTVIPNAATAGESSAESQPMPLRQELGLTDEHRIVGFVGRLARQKCLTDLVWAFQLLHQCVEGEVALVLAGEGPERDRLADLATSMGCREKVFFLGHRDDAAALIREFDVFCLPSSFEGMSNSLMEAMLQKVPVVVSDIEANQELVTNQQTGLVYPVGDCPAMTKAIKRLLDDGPLAERLAASAAEQIADNHSIEMLVARHRELYAKLLGLETAGSRQPVEQAE